MTPAVAARIAQQIVDRLFTNGQGERADRLVLTMDGPPTRDLGGWCEGAVLDQILALLVDAEGPRASRGTKENDDDVLSRVDH